MPSFPQGKSTDRVLLEDHRRILFIARGPEYQYLILNERIHYG